VPLEVLGPLGCGLQTGAGAVINALKVGVGQSIAVFGTGSVGPMVVSIGLLLALIWALARRVAHGRTLTAEA